MTPASIVGLAFLAVTLNFGMGLLVLSVLDGRDKVHAITRRWSEPKEFAAIVLWPFAAVWLLWKAYCRG